MANKPKPEDYRLLIERAWADIHHSRTQEWTALGVVTGGHLGLVQVVKFAKDIAIVLSTSTLIITAFIIGALFSLLGFFITCRHRQLMRIKLTWIYQAEERLGLIKKKEKNNKGIIPEDVKMKKSYEWRELALPRLLSTSGLILLFYIMIFVIDIFVILTVNF